MKDDPEFADAIDCMLSYFHKAAYNVTKYDKPQSLIHAQVAIIADKYDCGSLYELASTSYAITVKTIKSNDWAVIAGSIYDHTSNEIPSHVDLRSLIVPAVSCHYSLLKSIPQNESVINILRSNADLATDLLLYMMDSPKDRYGSERLAICTRCCYVHVGSPDCVKIVFGEFDKNYKICPKCGAGQKALLNEIYSCPSCGGIHNDAWDWWRRFEEEEIKNGSKLRTQQRGWPQFKSI